MKHAPDGRLIFVWNGRDLVEDTDRLIAAVAEACATRLFEMNSTLVWLKDDRPVVVNRPMLREIVTALTAGVRLVNHGSPEAPLWEVEFYSFGFPPGANVSKEPSDQVLGSLMAGLILRVAKGPSEPRRLTPQQQSEVRQRLAVGERKEQLAEVYHCDVELIQQLAR